MKEKNRIKKDLKDGTENFWWLRSAYIGDFNFVSFVSSISSHRDILYTTDYSSGIGVVPYFII